MLFRALFSAALFFGLAFGAVYVLRILLKDSPREEAASWNEETGENVNIVLPEEPVFQPGLISVSAHFMNELTELMAEQEN